MSLINIIYTVWYTIILLYLCYQNILLNATLYINAYYVYTAVVFDVIRYEYY